MERRLKERLIGAAVLVMAAVIFIPMILDDSSRNDSAITETNIPQRPDADFTSRVVPLKESDLGQGAGQEQDAKQEAPPAPVEETKAGPPPPQETEKPPAKPIEKPAAAPAPERKSPAANKVAPAPEEKSATADKAATGQGGKTAAAPSKETRGLTAWVVQVGSFSSEENARRLLKKLQDGGYPAFVEPVKQNSETVYRVRVGPELLRSEAGSLKDKLTRELKMEGMLVLQYP